MHDKFRNSFVSQSQVVIHNLQANTNNLLQDYNSLVTSSCPSLKQLVTTNTLADSYPTLYKVALASTLIQSQN